MIGRDKLFMFELIIALGRLVYMLSIKDGERALEEYNLFLKDVQKIAEKYNV